STPRLVVLVRWISRQDSRGYYLCGTGSHCLSHERWNAGLREMAPDFTRARMGNILNATKRAGSHEPVPRARVERWGLLAKYWIHVRTRRRSNGPECLSHSY